MMVAIRNTIEKCSKSWENFCVFVLDKADTAGIFSPPFPPRPKKPQYHELRTTKIEVFPVQPSSIA